MKRCLKMLLAVLMLSGLVVTPALAASEYGVVYDETDLLWSEELEQLGAQVMPELTGTYGIDLRVDVLTTLSQFPDLPQAAQWLYQEYDYGSEYGKNGVTLTLLVHEDETGVALDGWYPYAAGDSWELTTNATWNICRNSDTWLSEQAWSGDLEQDREMLAGAVADMANGLEQFVLAGGVVSTIWHPETGPLWIQSELPAEEPVEIPPVAQVPDAPAEAEKPVQNEVPQAPEQHSLAFVTDDAGLLEEEEKRSLEERAETLSRKYGFDVYIVTTEDYMDYAAGDIGETARWIYDSYSLGNGMQREGLLLLLSMAERDYALITNGELGGYAFNDFGREKLSEFFQDDLGEDAWFGGFSDYLKWSEDYLEAAARQEPYSKQNSPMEAGARVKAILIRVAVVVLLPLAVAGIVTARLSAKMKTVAPQNRAVSYVKGGLTLTGRQDRYTHTTQTRRKVESRSGTKSGKTETSGKF